MTIGGTDSFSVHLEEKIKKGKFFENIGKEFGKVQLRRPPNIQMFEESDARDWNDGNFRGQFDLGRKIPSPPTAPPPPPAPFNLDWGSSFGRSVFQGFLNQPNELMPNQSFQHENRSPNDLRNMEFRRYEVPQPRMDMERSMNEPRFGNNNPRMNVERDMSFELDFLDPQSQNNNDSSNFERQELSHDGNNHGGGGGGGEPIQRGPQVFDTVFFIGDFKMPYVSYETSLWRERSYAVRHFKRSPDFIIREKFSKQLPIVQHIYNDMMDISDLSDDSNGRLTVFSSSRFRNKLCLEWTKIYRARDYRSWEGWWRDFRNIDVDIKEQLKNFDCFNVKYNFMMPKGASAASDLVNRALGALQKNRNNYLGNMKVMYTIMDHNFLGNLSLETTAKLQDAIRSVPNHLWVFKLRSMIYMWYNYSQVIKTNNTGDGMYQAVLKQWKSPVIHWLAKQAFMELKSISKLEFPQFSEIFGRASNGGNGEE